MNAQATSPLIDRLGDMDFAHRLAAIRKQRGLTQQSLADQVGIHVTQVRRYEAGTSQPTLEVLRALAVALSVSTDSLVFNEDERGPADDQIRLHLEALNQLDDDEKATVINLIESVLLRHQARRLARTS
jgi:transcriptional regulator with XRE-family HTH domain